MITVFIDRGLKEAATVLSGNSFNIIKHTMPELEDYKKDLKEKEGVEPNRLIGVITQPSGKGVSTHYIYAGHRAKILSAGTLLTDVG